MKILSITLLIVYEIFLMIDNERFFCGIDVNNYLIKIIPIVILLILGLG